MRYEWRSRARELVLQALYAAECAEVEVAEDFSNVSEVKDRAPEAVAYARKLYVLVRDNMAETDKKISGLATNWKIDRLAIVDKNILRMALVELTYVTETPPKVVINEAIELAKKYSTAESASFVNGILDAYFSSERTTS